MFLHSKIKVPRPYSKILEANKKRMVWDEEYTLEYKAFDQNSFSSSTVSTPKQKISHTYLYVS